MISSHRWRMWRVPLLIGAFTGAGGCVIDGGSTKAPDSVDGTAQGLSQESPSAGGEAVDGPAGPRARRPPPGPGGPGFLLMAALHELDLTPAQQAAIEGALAKSAPGPRDRGPFAALAAGVRAGRIDATTVLTRTGEDRGRGEREHGAAAVADALQTLHATLTKEQRRALVDTVTKRTAEHEPPGERAGRKGPRGPGGDLGPMGHLLRGLDLTDAQREAIARALQAQLPADTDAGTMKKRFEARHAEMTARLEAFAADTFDAKAFVAPPSDAQAGGPGSHLARMVKDLAVVVPLLQPAQRETLAAQIEKGPPGPPPGR